MVLDISRAYAHIEHVLFGNVPSGLSKLRLVNEAGRHLCSMHGWWFLARAPYTLSLVSGQVEYALPSDWGQAITEEASNGLTNSLKMVSYSHLLHLETTQLPIEEWGFVGAVYFKTASGGLVPIPTLRLWPTPADSTQALTLAYRATWQEMDEDSNQYAQIPPYAEALYLEILEAFVNGYVRPETHGRRGQLLAEVEMGPICKAAKQNDGQQQSTLGPLMNGAIDTIAQGWTNLSRTTVPGPI